MAGWHMTAMEIRTFPAEVHVAQLHIFVIYLDVRGVDYVLCK